MTERVRREGASFVMGNTMNGAALRTHQNSVRPSLDTVKPSAAKVLLSSEPVRTEQNDAGKAEILALIDEARIAARLSDKEMQIASGAPKGQYSEAASGTRGNYAVQWLWAQPPVFWVEFIRLAQIAKGITQDDEEGRRQALAKATADELFVNIVECFRKGLPLTTEPGE